MTQEVLKLALEALEELYNTNNYWWQEVDEQTLEKIKHSIAAIKEALAQRTEQNFCSRCGKRVGGIDSIHTCTPPQEQDGQCKRCTDGCPACDATKLQKESHDLL